MGCDYHKSRNSCENGNIAPKFNGAQNKEKEKLYLKVFKILIL
jgi:hypothetical protein